MDGTPTSSAHKKMDKVIKGLKTRFLGQSTGKDEPAAKQAASTSDVTNDPDAKCSSHDFEIDDFVADDSKAEDHDGKDHWQMAYDNLGEKDRITLATLFPTTATKHPDTGRLRTKEILDQVVEMTKTQYMENQRKDDIRATAHKILNSALSFQDVISNAVKFDPTGYASIAWAIVSLGLTVWSSHRGSQTIS